MLQKLAIEQRHERILEFIRAPKTIQQIATELGVSYHTARNDIVDLVKRDHAQPAKERSEHGKTMYVSGGKRPMPVILIGRNRATLQEVVLAAANKPEQALKPMHISLDTIYQIAALLLVNAASEVPTEQKTLNEFRKTLSDSMMHIQRAMDVAKQMLAAPNLWNPETIKTLKSDTEFNEVAIQKAYLEYNEYILKVKG